jgi:phosphatidylinositol alpha-1,6-mannosyltransferase
MDGANFVTIRNTRALVLLGQLYIDGGIQRFNRTFLTACDRLGVGCDALSLADAEESRTNWSAPQSATVRVFGYDRQRFALAVCAAILSGRYDVIVVGHVNLMILVASFLSLHKRRATRVLMIAHGVDVWTGLERRRFAFALAKLDLILCVSQYTRDRIRAQRPELSEDRFTIFPNALSESWVDRFAGVRPAQSFSTTLPRRYLLSVTRLARGDRYKGLTTVLETLAMLPDTSIHYVIAGRGEDQAFLEGIVKRHQLEDRVHFFGGVSDEELADLYSHCAAFVLPSGKEGFGIVFLEAMYFGAPVIAAREKGAVDVVQHEQTGLLVPYGDTVALSAAITRLLQDGSLRARLLEKGRESVLAGGPFCFDAYVERLGNLLAVSQPVRD